MVREASTTRKRVSCKVKEIAQRLAKANIQTNHISLSNLWERQMTLLTIVESNASHLSCPICLSHNSLREIRLTSTTGLSSLRTSLAYKSFMIRCTSKQRFTTAARSTNLKMTSKPTGLAPLPIRRTRSKSIGAALSTSQKKAWLFAKIKLITRTNRDQAWSLKDSRIYTWQTNQYHGWLTSTLLSGTMNFRIDSSCWSNAWLRTLPLESLRARDT